jgi:hypothetical protein
VSKRSSQYGRNLLVWMHIVTSVGWMSQALALLALMLLAMSDPGARDAAIGMARMLDRQVLAQLANASAFTGFMLAALTPWGYFRYWWVLGKFAITVVQLTIGIFFLDPDGTVLSAAAAALMMSAIGFQAWMSVAKPWKKTPWAQDTKRLPTAPPRLFVICFAVPIVDLALSLYFGFPAPLFSLLTVIGYSIRRSANLRRLTARGPEPDRRRVRESGPEVPARRA